MNFTQKLETIERTFTFKKKHTFCIIIYKRFIIAKSIYFIKCYPSWKYDISKTYPHIQGYMMVEADMRKCNLVNIACSLRLYATFRSASRDVVHKFPENFRRPQILWEIIIIPFSEWPKYKKKGFNNSLTFTILRFTTTNWRNVLTKF